MKLNLFIWSQLPLLVLSFNRLFLHPQHVRTTIFTEPQYNYDHLDKDNYNKIRKINQEKTHSKNYMPYKKITNTTRNIPNKNELLDKMVSISKQIMENISQQNNNDNDEPLIINLPSQATANWDSPTLRSGESLNMTIPNKKLKNGFLDTDGIFRYNRSLKRGDGNNIDRTRRKYSCWEEDDEGGQGQGDIFTPRGSLSSSNEFSKENNFQLIKPSTYTFKNIGGYENIKKELLQISDILIDYSKYKKFNVRTPKGLILDGPPGNGKTLIAKCFSGEIQIPFIQCSGAEFSDKYVGVGASRIRELFELAEKNTPCIIFIDEIDALARKRGNDMVNSNSEKDQTLNQLLVCMDGFKELSGVFVIGATNRIDMLDEALLRPGRMDKHIYIGNPDKNTRNEILKIHLKGKPINEIIHHNYLIDLTSGFSGSQIENLLNEAMLKALRENRIQITVDDLEQTANRIISGFQGLENKYSPDMIRRIIIHELGHAIIGLFSKEHPKLSKVCINLWSPKTPGYTIFETTDEDNNIHTKGGLFAHLTVLFSGRIAEEFFYGDSITTGARQDLEQAHNLANDMILKYGMGKQNVYPYSSDKYKNIIDEEINDLLLLAAIKSRKIITDSKNLILDCCEILKQDNKLFADQIVEIVDTKYPYLWDIYKTQSIYK